MKSDRIRKEIQSNTKCLLEKKSDDNQHTNEKKIIVRMIKLKLGVNLFCLYCRTLRKSIAR